MSALLSGSGWRKEWSGTVWSSEWAEWASSGSAGKLNGDNGGCNIETLLGANVDLNPLLMDEELWCCCCCCCCWAATPKLNVWAKSAAAVETDVELLGKNMDDVLVNVVMAAATAEELVLPYKDGLIDCPVDPLAPLWLEYPEPYLKKKVKWENQNFKKFKFPLLFKIPLDLRGKKQIKLNSIWCLANENY